MWELRRRPSSRISAFPDFFPGAIVKVVMDQVLYAVCEVEVCGIAVSVWLLIVGGSAMVMKVR